MVTALIKRWFKGRELRPTPTLAEMPGVLFMLPDLTERSFDVVVLDPARKREVLQRVLEWAGSKP
jgi:hypothetical protein